MTAPSHLRFRRDQAIHQPVRLSIMALLEEAERVDFAFLRDQLQLGDSSLSRHLTALEELGYVEIHKVFERKRARTWALSPQGRRAFDRYTEVL